MQAEAFDLSLAHTMTDRSRLHEALWQSLNDLFRRLQLTNQDAGLILELFEQAMKREHQELRACDQNAALKVTIEGDVDRYCCIDDHWTIEMKDASLLTGDGVVLKPAWLLVSAEPMRAAADGSPGPGRRKRRRATL